jgi:hypothetical protein
MRTIHRLGRMAPIALLLLGLAGCFNPFDPRIASTTSVYIPPPAPNSAQNVIRLFEWCWKNRDISTYKEIFTADFRFVFALGDSAGNLFRDDPVNRETELNIARHLFVGGGAEAPAASVALALDPTLRALPDSRLGKNPKWHNEIVTSVNLDIKTEDNKEYRVTGSARFFVVRGDSARIPQELSFRPDSTRWYIDQWNDETYQGAGVTPTDPGTLGSARSGVRMTVTSIVRVPRTAGATGPPPTFDLTWGKLSALYAR